MNAQPTDGIDTEKGKESRIRRPGGCTVSVSGILKKLFQLGANIHTKDGQGNEAS